jgi:S-adenosylmethionine:tRNA ribosyltransferase-isomerase
MNAIQNISIADFQYELPNEKIAYEPLLPKDSSKLLVYKNGAIQDDHFYNVANHLPENSLLVFNNSKVIPARLPFFTETCACVELFLLEPIQPNSYELALGKNGDKTCTWKCFVGNLKKWKYTVIDAAIDSIHCKLTAERLSTIEDAYEIKFSWDADLAFSEIIEALGKIPLPPYIKRETIESDKITYQTIYAKIDGSVAAPTAGLHFTDNTLASLRAKNIQTNHVTLHVGAGTFKPVKAATIGNHNMHSEYFVVEKSLLENLIAQPCITAVGTTSCRTLETLYWLGVKLLLNSNADISSLSQWEVYHLALENNFSKQEALTRLLNHAAENQLHSIVCNTQILIAPGYPFQIVDILITNFHQPQSTLLLLIAAFLDEENNWRSIYQHALDNNYRFLSYGDSSILFSNNRG